MVLIIHFSELHVSMPCVFNLVEWRKHFTKVQCYVYVTKINYGREKYMDLQENVLTPRCMVSLKNLYLRSQSRNFLRHVVFIAVKMSIVVCSLAASYGRPET
jgi:hypothetical protein